MLEAHNKMVEEHDSNPVKIETDVITEKVKKHNERFMQHQLESGLLRIDNKINVYRPTLKLAIKTGAIFLLRLFIPVS
jgi:hypothetical protein